ncbi:hypothetical protein ACFWUW_24715 [Streptomyces sp. NPDC058655]|uniref:hypothetical protein n=1 Tax=unclassified Streptomyces TaxID=2593676 RepID=UPI003661F7A5
MKPSLGVPQGAARLPGLGPAEGEAPGPYVLARIAVRIGTADVTWLLRADGRCGAVRPLLPRRRQYACGHIAVVMTSDGSQGRADLTGGPRTAPGSR